MLKAASSQFVRKFCLIPVTLMLAVPAWACPVASMEGTIEVRSLTAENFSPVSLVKADDVVVSSTRAQAATECVGGFAGVYPCNNVDLLSFMPLGDIGGGGGNDIWGWTDPMTDKEYAIMGRSNGTSFVDISDPENPVYLGNLPTHTSSSTWRDMKVNNNHVYIVSEASGHGMQIFDLTQLRGQTGPPQTYTNTAHYGEFSNAHNIAINETTNFAYAVGTSTCSGGLHMIDISDPVNPTFSGCYSADGYTHDTQCVTFAGQSHVFHHGSELCFNSNEDTLTIVDVTNKSAPVQLSRLGYAGSRYTHQGWLTEDQNYFLLDDELDESGLGHNTKTRVFDVSDPSNPVLVGSFDSTVAAIDHNMYVKDQYAFQANYRAGLRILEVIDGSTANLQEEGYFDIYPDNDNASFNGAWSTYPYFPSGTVIVSGIEQGLFMLRPTSLAPAFNVELEPDLLQVCGMGEVSTQVSVSANEIFTGNVDLSLGIAPSGVEVTLGQNSVTPPGQTSLTANVTTAEDGQYRISVDGVAGKLGSSVELNLEVSSSIPLAAAATLPANGATVVSSNQPLHWSAVDGAYRYDLQVATDAGFSNIIVDAPDLTMNSYSGGALPADTTLFWRVVAHNACGSSTSKTNSFTTAAPACQVYTSSDVPVAIDAGPANTVTSALNSTSPGQIIDVNVVALQGSHTYLGDLAFQLQGPELNNHRGPGNNRHANRALVRIIERSCGSLNDFSLSLDDSAGAAFPCPYNDGGTYLPSNDLSAFVGSPGTGDWTLIVADEAGQDGGSLDGWGVEVCTTPDPELLDSDGDGIADDLDNCTLVANPDQRDTHGDGYGNLCDPDLNNDGTVNFLDLSAFSDAFLTTGAGLDADLNGDEAVNFLDLTIFTDYFFGPPGPSGVAMQ